MTSQTGWFIDGGVIVSYLVLIVGIGLFMGRKENSLFGFALGGRKIPWWAVLASIVAAETSAGTFFGTPGEGFHTRSFTFLQLALGTILARALVSYIFLKPYYKFNVCSIYEYLTIRFGTTSKNAASGIFLITRVLASGARLYVAAIVLVLAYEFLQGISPSPHQQLLIYIGASITITLITGVYTSLGGIKAVIWTDLIQACIMITSAAIALGFLFFHLPNGWSSFTQAFAEVKHPSDLFFSSGLDPSQHGWQKWKGMFQMEYTLFAGLIGSTFMTMATHGTDQDMVQRMLTAPDVKKSRLSLILSGLADIPISLLFISIGILLFAFYRSHSDPNLPNATNEIFCYYILHQLPPGVRGLLFAGIFATTMGSLSTALNALATSFTQDWYLPYIHPNAPEEKKLATARLATVVFGLLIIAVSSAVSFLVIQHTNHPQEGDLRIIPIVLGIFGYTYGSLLGIFFVGMLTKTRGNDRGNLIGMIAGFVVVAILSGLPNEVAGIFQIQLYQQPNWLPVIEFPWRVLFGTISTFLVAVCFKTPKEALIGSTADQNQKIYFPKMSISFSQNALSRPSAECKKL